MHGHHHGTVTPRWPGLDPRSFLYSIFQQLGLGQLQSCLRRPRVPLPTIHSTCVLKNSLWGLQGLKPPHQAGGGGGAHSGPCSVGRGHRPIFTGMRGRTGGCKLFWPNDCTPLEVRSLVHVGEASALFLQLLHSRPTRETAGDFQSQETTHACFD